MQLYIYEYIYMYKKKQHLFLNIIKSVVGLSEVWRVEEHDAKNSERLHLEAKTKARMPDSAAFVGLRDGCVCVLNFLFFFLTQSVYCLFFNSVLPFFLSNFLRLIFLKRYSSILAFSRSPTDSPSRFSTLLPIYYFFLSFFSSIHHLNLTASLFFYFPCLRLCLLMFLFFFLFHS